MAASSPKPAVELWIRQVGSLWCGIAGHEGRLVATSVAERHEDALRFLRLSLPDGVTGSLAEGWSDFAESTARMLAAIESGDESGKRFVLSPLFVPEPSATVYRLVAAIPLGYACSYGRIAEAAGTIAREVGRLMATNPLYPIVPCHRVVGADYSLVGYRGTTSGSDLDDKLARLLAEARGYREELTLESAGALLVFPVERVIDRVRRGRGNEEHQLSLW